MSSKPEAMRKAIEFLQSHDSFAVLAHANPEGDAIGASLALAALLNAIGKKAVAANHDPSPANTRFLSGADSLINHPDRLPRLDAAVIVDCGDLYRIGEGMSAAIRGLPVLNIDHHGTNSFFGDVNWVDPEASSTGEMVAAIAREMGLALSAETATCLFTAIATDTGSFQFSNATPAAFRAAADMVEAGARPELVSEHYYHSTPASHLLLLASTLATLDFDKSGKRGDIHITRAMFEKSGAGPDAAEGMANLITDVAGVMVSALYRQTGDENWKVSLRSKGEVNVAQLAARFGGGGHKNAAGLTIKGKIDEVKKKIRREIDDLIASREG